MQHRSASTLRFPSLRLKSGPGRPSACKAKTAQRAEPKQWDRVSKNLDALKFYYNKVSNIEPPQHKEPAAPIRVSGPQGKVEPLTIIDDPSAWKSSDFKGNEKAYQYSFTESDIAELKAAVTGIDSRGMATNQNIQKLTKEDFHLPSLGPKLIELGKEASLGRGFQILRNFPVDDLSAEHTVIAYWGLAKYLGRSLICQTDIPAPGSNVNTGSGDYYGSLLNHVTSGGHAVKNDDVAKIPLPFHSDQGATDIVSLLCVSRSKAGGASRWVSAVAIHNELLRRGRQDLVEALTSPGWWSPAKVDQMRTLQEKGKTVWENTTPFIYHDGYLSCAWPITMYHEELEERKRLGYLLTPIQEEAYWAVVALANDPELYIEMMLEPGDIQWLANHSVLHSRAPVENDGQQVRHLIRWWGQSAAADARPQDPRYARTRNVDAGRG